MSKIRDWQRFVLKHGSYARTRELVAILGVGAEDIERIRNTGAATRTPRKPFAVLFSLWHGRAPRDDEWPIPARGGRGQYEWQAPESALLASLTGRLGARQIVRVLTKRLRETTGYARARRSYFAVVSRMNKIGVQTNDFVGGISTYQAAREIGNITAINQAIARKRGQERLRAVRIGRYWMIPHAEWERWKSTRVFPPAGYVTLASIRTRLGIRSDSKLPEFAKMGCIPTAIRCNVFGTKVHTSVFGTWFIDANVARKLLADRRAGRPMPWHGKPMTDNLKATFKLWRKRKHPAECENCEQLWGKDGAPSTFAEYSQRYPQLPFGAKRHLTKKWTPGLTLPEVARKCGVRYHMVQRAADVGVLEATRIRGRRYVTKAAATRWKTRKCPTGSSRFSWISLATARKQYLFTPAELRRFIRTGKLRSKVGTNGPMRGITYVLRHQCGQIRERLGFTEQQAAARIGITVARLRILLKGVDLRGAKAIPLHAIHTVIKRVESREGYTIEEAAVKLGVTVDWVRDRKADGTIRIRRARWDQRRAYITAPMMKRLSKAKRKPQVPPRLGQNWLLLGDAAIIAGVCTTTVMRWADEGTVARRRSITGWRYRRASVCARARRYWKSCRFRRAVPPDWLRPARSARSMEAE